jgi:tetratricopeptide (TPR) repeat protein
VIESFKQAIKIDPDLAEAHNNLAVAYGKSGKYKEAIDAFKQAIRINPDYSEAHFNLGIAYLILKDNGSALEQYEILKNLDPYLANLLFEEINSE